MKRLIFLTLAVVVLAAVAAQFGAPEIAVAEKPTPSVQQATWNFTVTVDSTDAYVCDTLTTPTGSSNKLFTFSDAKNYSTLHGWYVFEYTAVDTGTGGVDVDTSKDTLWMRFYTSDVSGTPSKLLYSNKVTAVHATAGVVNADYLAFDLTDSTTWDQVYAEIIYGLADSTYTKARLAAGIDYKLTLKYYGK